MLKKLVLVLIAVTLVAAAGCSKKTVVVDDKGTKATVDVSKNRQGETEFEMKTKEGKVKVSSKEGKPDNWPDDMPFYKGAKVEAGTTMTGAADAMSVSLNTTDDFAKVAAWYENELKSEDWTTDLSTTQQGGTEGASSRYIGVSKDDRQGAVIISDAADGKGVIIVITITKKQ